MKTTRNHVLLFVLFATAVANAALKPTVWADIPDVATLRVGDAYYMTSTTMHFNPGIPVMASKDLVCWKIVSGASVIRILICKSATGFNPPGITFEQSIRHVPENHAKPDRASGPYRRDHQD